MSLGERSLSMVCSKRDQMPLVLTVAVVMLVLLLFSLLFLEPGTASFAIAMFDLILLVGSLVVFGLLYWYCTRRAMTEVEG